MTYSDIILGSLENDGRCLSYHAEGLKRHVDMLAELPSFRTRAEANLEQAERNLLIALDTVKAARKDIAGKRPVVRMRKAG